MYFFDELLIYNRGKLQYKAAFFVEINALDFYFQIGLVVKNVNIVIVVRIFDSSKQSVNPLLHPPTTPPTHQPTNPSYTMGSIINYIKSYPNEK